MLYPQQNATRTVLELNGLWDFAREQDGTDYASGFAPEKRVPVPGSFNDLFTQEEFRMWMDGVWYARRFLVPNILQGQRLVLRFGAVNYKARVYLNGEALGEHETGYTPFEFDVTDAVRWNEVNMLTVRIENNLTPDTVPQGNLQAKAESGQIAGQYPNTCFDFFPYTGIHRPVYLYTTSVEAHVRTLRVTTTVAGDTAEATVQGACAGGCTRARVVIDETGDAAETDCTTGGFTLAVQIPNVKLWDEGQPNLYHARVELLREDGTLIDTYTQRFGVRTVAVEGNRFLLNGRPVYFQGFGKHEDFHLIGKGLNHSVNVRDFELMQWIHANSFRTTHYPYAEETIELADEYGFLVIGEAPAVSVNFDFVTDQTLKTHLQAMRELIERDLNHPSVVMWSVANEANADRPNAHDYFKALVDCTRELDPTRPVTAATCFGVKDATLNLFDVISVNTYPGWYFLPGQIEPAYKHLKEELTAIHAACGKPIFITEFGADTIAGFHGLPGEQWTEEYQTDLVLRLIDGMRELDFVIGEHLWNFADFRTAQNHFRVYGNKKGIFTRDRQPKMVARFLRDRWAHPRYA